jgi:uncharacterized membrane protein YphA (DoxX/SURF4 family)
MAYRRGSQRRSDPARVLFGLAAIASGVVIAVWPDYKAFEQLQYVLSAANGPAFVYATATAQIAGGTALLFPRTAKMGAVVLGAVYLVFAAFVVPRIVLKPLVYDRWGNFFEPFSLAVGAAMVYARSSAAFARAGRILFGLCVLSFGLEQAFYLDATASLVPRWIPPSPTFWAIATTVCFGLAAFALLPNLQALLAARLVALMIGLFGVLVWVPAALAKPRSRFTWSELTETFAIAGAAWIVAGVLGESRPPARSRSTIR